jgi:hypothetical protein
MIRQGAEDRRQRRVLVGLALLFFAPLGLAFYLYYGYGAWRPVGRVNAGELIDPARPLPPLVLPLFGPGNTSPDFLKGKWTLLYVEPAACGQACRKDLYNMRQVRLALDRDMNRVQRVLIADVDCCDAKELREQHPDLVAIRASAADAPLRALLPHRDGATQFYLIDPLGNLMMCYSADANAKGMLEDLKRLLQLSSIG